LREGTTFGGEKESFNLSRGELKLICFLKVRKRKVGSSPGRESVSRGRGGLLIVSKGKGKKRLLIHHGSGGTKRGNLQERVGSKKGTHSPSFSSGKERRIVQGRGTGEPSSFPRGGDRGLIYLRQRGGQALGRGGKRGRHYLKGNAVISEGGVKTHLIMLRREIG